MHKACARCKIQRRYHEPYEETYVFGACESFID